MPNFKRYEKIELICLEMAALVKH